MNRITLPAFAGAVAAAMFFAPERAVAQCFDFGGGFYECSGTDTLGVSDDFGFAIVNVLPGAEISTEDKPAISVTGGDDLVVNDGAVTSSNDNAIVMGDRGVVENYASAPGGVVGGLSGVVMGLDGSLLNEGTIVGHGGYGLEAGAGAIVMNHGSIGGSVGSILFSDGVDDLTMTGPGTISGDAFFGAGDDLLTFFGAQAPMPGLNGSVFRGGPDSDMVSFNGLPIDTLLALSLLPALGEDGLVLRVETEAGAPESLIYLAEFETFVFNGDLFTVDDLAGLGRPQVIPVPAALPLLASAFGLAGLLVRGRRARA